MQAVLQTRNISYWRDKRGHEVDFILNNRKGQPVAIECKWSASEFEADNLKVFRRAYPEGMNFVVANDVARGYSRSYDDLHVKFVNLKELTDKISRTE